VLWFIFWCTFALLASLWYNNRKAVKMAGASCSHYSPPYGQLYHSHIVFMV